MSSRGYSPYAAGPGTPGRAEAAYNYFDSPSPTPSPNYYSSAYAMPPKTPQRPATRAHNRGASTGYHEFRPTTAFSPRYTSTGEYATRADAGFSPKVSSKRKQSFSSKKGATNVYHTQHHYPPPTQPLPPKHERRHSHSHHRTSHGDSDEDEYFEVEGVTFVLPAESRSRRPRRQSFNYRHTAPGHGTDYYYETQAYPVMPEYVRYEPEMPPARAATRMANHAPRGHSRRQSEIIPPQRSATARPSLSQQKKAAAAAAPAAKTGATEADARKHKIPAGYSLKNWDPTEEPIILLGSVFDANSLGKWIYDWTVYHHGASTPMSDMAGELWLLLIQLSGKVKRSEEVVPKVRAKDNQELLEDFILSGERIMDKLRSLLKRCEAPMIKANKRKEQSSLGNKAGVEFVECLFGRERELERTERFMQQVRLWNIRFDANCETILKRPTA